MGPGDESLVIDQIREVLRRAGVPAKDPAKKTPREIFEAVEVLYSCIAGARYIGSLMRDGGLTQVEVATMLGYEQPFISSRLRLLRLPAEIQEILRRKKDLKADHGDELVRLKAFPAEMILIARSAIDGRWSVLRLRSEISRFLAENGQLAGSKRGRRGH